MIRAISSRELLRCEQGSTFGLDIFQIPLNAFATIKLVEAYLNFGPQFLEPALAQLSVRPELKKGIGHGFAFRDVAASLHRVFDELLILILESDRDLCHAFTLTD